MTASSERRSVTVLFSDLKGFTSFSEGRDPEEVQEAIHALFERFRVAIEAEGGRVDKFIGDAVMAVYGAPVAHEDDPLRAVRAGLRLQDIMREMAAARGWTFALRVGIHAGEVVWGGIAGERATVLGDAVNVAQRLESLCEPGRVTVSSEIERATRGRVECRKLAETTVKGRQAAVKPFEVEGLSPWDPLDAVEGEVVGREAELALLEERFRAASERREPAWISIEGEPGAGKSALLAELRRRLEARGVPVAAGYSAREETSAASAFRHIAVRLAGGAEAARVRGMFEAELAEVKSIDVEDRKTLAGLLALSVGLEVADSGARGLPPERRAAEVARAWRLWLDGWTRSGARPAVMLFEDVHAADPVTRSMLDAGPASMTGVPLLVVATRRPSESGPMPAPWQSVSLGPLPPRAIHDLATSVLGGPVEGALASWLHERCGGNPYAARQVLRFLEEQGAIVDVPARLDGARLPRALPQTLSGFLTSRIDRLPADARETLKLAAGLGTRFWSGHLADVTGAGRATALDALVAARFLAARPPPSHLDGETEYAFESSLLRDAAAALLMKKERRDLVLRAVPAFRSRLERGAWKGPRSEALALCAQWVEDGDGPAAAEPAWLEAGRAAAQEWRPEVSVAFLRRAGRSPEARSALGSALSATGRPEEGLAEIRAAALAEPEASKRHAHLSEALSRLSLNEDALASAQRALETAVSPLEQCRARLACGRALHRFGRFDEALSHALECETIARSENFRPELAGALQVHGSARLDRGDFDAARTAYGEARAIALELKDRSLAANCGGCIAKVHFMRGELAQAVPYMEEKLRAARETGDRFQIAEALSSLGAVQQEMGLHEAALHLYRQVLEIVRGLGNAAFLATTLNNMGILLFQQGRREEALQAIDESVRLRAAAGERAGYATSLHNRAGFLGRMGRVAEAERDHQEALAIRRAIGDQAGLASTLTALGILRRDNGDRSSGRLLIEEALALRREHADARGIAICLTTLAWFVGESGERAAAIALYEESLALSRAHGLRPNTAETLANLGRFLVYTGDVAGGVARMREAETIYRAMGAAKVCVEVREEIARAERPA